MTSPPKKVKVKCPKCGQVYDDWYRPSIDLALDHFDDEYIEEATTATCPHCKHKVSFEVLIVREDGVWEFRNSKNRVCPECGSNRAIPIVYGLPTSGLGLKAERGEVHLGGCCVGRNDPKWHCRDCEHDWR